MAGLCEGGNEPPGSLKAIYPEKKSNVVRFVTRSASFQHRFRVNVWAGILGEKVIGPFIIEDRVRGENYLKFVEVPRPNTIGLLFWVCMKEKVYQTETASREEREELVAKINTAAMEVHQHGLDNVQRELRRHAEACVRARGGHFEHLL
ncbi:hypothetical protein ANN_25812 [Periplaneta americana]|uniref:Uncharacterized protein n=1 Tax=Periplaneta americana TaxID=6978 RepID=A0ABQ8S474_PERAM|nr:hypothetical protein ANN_25812 [Periplaneta americana]